MKKYICTLLTYLIIYGTVHQLDHVYTDVSPISRLLSLLSLLSMLSCYVDNSIPLKCRILLMDAY